MAAAMPKATPDAIKKGKEAYATNCVACHGDALDGNGPAGAVLTPKPRNLLTDAYTAVDKKKRAADSAEVVFETVAKGMAGTTMAGFESSISETDRWNIVHYILDARKAAKKGKK